jgi:hypothetical protein
MFRLTPLLRFLPYYLISNSVPYLITHQVLPRNYGYVIRLKVKISRNFLVLLFYLYQAPHIPVKENLKKFSSVQKIRRCSLCLKEHFLTFFNNFPNRSFGSSQSKYPGPMLDLITRVHLFIVGHLGLPHLP